MGQEADLERLALVVDGKVLDIYPQSKFRKHQRLYKLKGVKVITAHPSMRVGDMVKED